MHNDDNNDDNHHGMIANVVAYLDLHLHACACAMHHLATACAMLSVTRACAPKALKGIPLAAGPPLIVWLASSLLVANRRPLWHA